MTEPARARPRIRRGTETRKRYRRITFRVLEDEYLQVEAAASEAGLTLASYTRRRAVPEPATASRRRPSVEVIALVRLQAELNRIGSNIHQLLRHVSFGRLVDSDELHAAFTGYREAIEAIKAMAGPLP
ncbi:MAG TPA: hypothetical protein VMH39_10420 [Gemmatimonadaceae bacterium]|nr:hypothetical protein [Gemmatimonadaceae bacterium]